MDNYDQYKNWTTDEIRLNLPPEILEEWDWICNAIDHNLKVVNHSEDLPTSVARGLQFYLNCLSARINEIIKEYMNFETNS